MPSLPSLPIPPDEEICVKPQPRKKAENAVKSVDVSKTKVQQSGKCQSIQSKEKKKKKKGPKSILNSNVVGNSKVVNDMNLSKESNKLSESNELNESNRSNELNESNRSNELNESDQSNEFADLRKSLQSFQPDAYDEPFASVQSDESVESFLSANSAESPELSPLHAVISQTPSQKPSFSNVFSSFFCSIRSLFQHPSTVFNKHSIFTLH